MHNFVMLERNYSAYGGTDCRKDSVILDGTSCMLKYFSDKNDPICEFIGCHVFELLGINAQKTDLGIYNGEVVVLCSDFREGKDLVEFNKIKVSSSRDLKNPENGDITNGEGTNLGNVLEVVRNSYFFEGLNAEEFFWKLFIIDYIIDNPDRNNGNWGLLIKNGQRSFAPVYDCGNCLQSKWDDEKCQKALDDDRIFEETVWKRKVCFYTDDDGKRINPFKLIQEGRYPICSMVLTWVLQQDFDSVYQFIQECNLISNVKREFYLKIITARVEMLKNTQENLNNMKLF